MDATANRLLLAAALVAGLTACPPAAVYRTAEPVEKGAWQVGAASSVGTMSDDKQEQSLPTAQLEVMGRYGLTDDLDVGAKLFIPGIELNATWRLFHGAQWSWAVLPSVASVRTQENGLTPKAQYVFASAAIVASRRLGRNWAIGFGGSSGAGVFWPETGGTAEGISLGTFLHMDYRLGRRWHFTPEIGAYSVIMGEVPVTGGALNLGAAFRYDI